MTEDGTDTQGRHGLSLSDAAARDMSRETAVVRRETRGRVWHGALERAARRRLRRRFRQNGRERTIRFHNI